MTIDEQIEAAWEEYCGNAELNPNLFSEKQDGFREGYLTALRKAMQVSDLSSLRHGDPIECRFDDGSWVSGEVNRPLPMTQMPMLERAYCNTICRSPLTNCETYRIIDSLPSPSTIFGEGV